MNKEELKEIIKEVLQDQEIINRFSYNFASGIGNYLIDIMKQQNFIKKIGDTKRGKEEENCGFTCGISCLNTSAQEAE